MTCFRDRQRLKKDSPELLAGRLGRSPIARPRFDGVRLRLAPRLRASAMMVSRALRPLPFTR